MLHLLLVSIQMMSPRMALLDSKQELISLKVQNNSELNVSSEKDLILESLKIYDKTLAFFSP